MKRKLLWIVWIVGTCGLIISALLEIRSGDFKIHQYIFSLIMVVLVLVSLLQRPADA